MINIKIDRSELICESKEKIIKGSVNYHKLRIKSIVAWEGLRRRCIFYTDGDWENSTVVAADDDIITVPWERIEKGDTLYFGFVGVDSQNQIKAKTNVISLRLCDGVVDIGSDPIAPTPDIYTQILERIGDLNSLVTEDKSSLVGAINEVAQSASIDFDKIVIDGGNAGSSDN